MRREEAPELVDRVKVDEPTKGCRSWICHEPVQELQGLDVHGLREGLDALDLSVEAERAAAIGTGAGGLARAREVGRRPEWRRSRQGTRLSRGLVFTLEGGLWCKLMPTPRRIESLLADADSLLWRRRRPILWSKV